MDRLEGIETPSPITDHLRERAPNAPRLSLSDVRVVHDALTLALQVGLRDLPFGATVGEWTDADRARAQGLWDELTSLRLDALAYPGGSVPEYRAERTALRHHAFEAACLLDDMHACVQAGELMDALSAARGFKSAAGAVLRALLRMREALEVGGPS